MVLSTSLLAEHVYINTCHDCSTAVFLELEIAGEGGNTSFNELRRIATFIDMIDDLASIVAVLAVLTVLTVCGSCSHVQQQATSDSDAVAADLEAFTDTSDFVDAPLAHVPLARTKKDLHSGTVGRVIDTV